MKWCPSVPGDTAFILGPAAKPDYPQGSGHGRGWHSIIELGPGLITPAPWFPPAGLGTDFSRVKNAATITTCKQDFVALIFITLSSWTISLMFKLLSGYL